MLQARLDEVETASVGALLRVASAAEGWNDDAIAHPSRVADLSADIAEHLREDAEFVRRIRLATRLHDIGKVAIADAILTKPGPLSSAEFDVVKTHTLRGFEILDGSDSKLTTMAAEIALSHHERWDGGGYPEGRAGEAIPMSARIVHVADVYDALLSARVYKQPWAQVDAINYIAAGSGTRFEPRVVEAFLALIVCQQPVLADAVDRPASA